jgi:hypothetical protein
MLPSLSTIVIRNIAAETAESRVRELVRQFGRVLSLTGKSHGNVEVMFDRPEAAISVRPPSTR